MNALLGLFTLIWRRRYLVIVSLIAFPMLALLYSHNRPAAYQAVQTLAINAEASQSPLLKNVQVPDFVSILERRLKSPDLAESALREIGLLFDGTTAPEKTARIQELSSNLRLIPAGENVLEIHYRSADATNLLRTLETVSFLFIDDMLAPERFAIDDELSQLAEQVKFLSNKQELTERQLKPARNALEESSAEKRDEALRRVTALEFEAQSLRLQRGLAEEKYQAALKRSQERLSQPVIRPLGNPVLVNKDASVRQHSYFLCLGLLLALAFTTLVLVLQKLFDRSLRADAEIRAALGLKILGRMPNLGDIQVEDGRIAAMPRLNI